MDSLCSQELVLKAIAVPFAMLRMEIEFNEGLWVAWSAFARLCIHTSSVTPPYALLAVSSTTTKVFIAHSKSGVCIRCLLGMLYQHCWPFTLPLIHVL